MRNFVSGAFAAIAMGTAAVSAQAADLGALKAPPPPPPPVIDSYQPFQVRLKVGAVIPTEGTATIYDRGTGSYLGNQTILQAVGYSWGAGSIFNGASTTISTSIQPMLDVAYFLNRNWAIEAICCVSNHHVQGIGVIGGSSVIKSWVFPPSLMLQYHFTNFGAFQPYLGVGVNFTAFWGTRAGNQPFPFFLPNLPTVQSFNNAYAATITPSWGVVGQLGFDYMFNEHWGVNIDAKYIMMEPNAHVWVANTNPLGVFSVPVNLAVKINPVVISGGLTYRFGGSVVPPVLASF